MLKKITSVVIWLPTAALFLLLSAQASQASQSPAHPLPQFSEPAYEMPVAQARLPNGLQIFIAPNHSSPTISLQIWYRVGSQDELPGKTGLAHFFEHLMFRGLHSKSDESFDRQMELAGAIGVNAFTTRDSTVYFEELPKGALGLALRLEADRMNGLKMSQPSFESEREVIENERRLRIESDAEGLLLQRAFEKAFPNHPYQRPVVGIQSDLKKLTLQDAIHFYHTHYTPSQALLVISGDVEAAQAIKTIESLFGKIKSTIDSVSASKEVAARSTRPVTLPRLSPSTEKILLPIKTEKLLLAFRIPGLNDPDRLKIELAKELLCDARSSRLRYAVIGTGIGSSLTCDALDDAFDTLFLIFIDLNIGKSHVEAKNAILEELLSLEDTPASMEELSIAKNRYRFNFLSHLEGNDNVAHFIGKYQSLTGDFRRELSHLRNAESISAGEIEKTLLKFFVNTPPLSIAGVPK